ncbi:EAL domain-containing protein [Nitrosomonas sp.]|uniref:sensor domain-containing phosphodiesterase n=2 Tax=Nitrosomonas sp. TaxID=42353 RepID=UPI00283EFD29|nr:EAL domain-containing protein [Nitrosomonas sp.]MCP5241826.1 EAL domain-containing protein [Burkholderiales bacterium]MDR4513111.1 EAL domain-containing protein [Nitrosomonas sp.]
MLINTFKPFVSASVALFMATLLVIIDLYFDDIAITWTAILWILLFSAILIMLGQFIHAEKEMHSYSYQLTANKERLTNEIKHRLWAEKSTAEAKIKSQIIDENIPVLLAYFSFDQRCKYHNRIFRKWFGLKADQIDGKLLEEFADDEFASSIKKHFKDILSGKTVHEERVLKSTKGFPYIFTEQYVPHLDSKGKTVGFYTLHTPCAQDKKRLAPKKNDQTDKPAVEHSNKKNTHQVTKKPVQTGVSTDRIIQAIKGGEFYLYCQKIIPLDSNALLPTQYEILIRMAEEENNLMPPGSFLPLVDQLKMMPQLDRWVANYIVKSLSTNAQECRSVFSLNVARDTLCDKTFVEFIQDKIQKSKIPANQLCFEIEEIDAKSNLIETMFFTEKIRELGCLVTLCGFSQDSQSIELLKKIKIDFLKIDGIIVCNMIYEHEELTKVKSINQIARQLNIKTIAELVENEETISKLREIGIHYAQGLGVEKPYPLNNLLALLQKTTNSSSVSQNK